MLKELFAKVLSKAFGETGRAGDLYWDADMLTVMPLKVVSLTFPMHSRRTFYARVDEGARRSSSSGFACSANQQKAT